MKKDLMGLKLYSIWQKDKNPRSKPASWYRWTRNIRHVNPNRELLHEILLPLFKEYADNYVWQIEEGRTPESALSFALNNGKGLANVTAGKLSINLANDILDYFVENGHIEILETKLKDAIETVQNSGIPKEVSFEQ